MEQTSVLVMLLFTLDFLVGKAIRDALHSVLGSEAQIPNLPIGDFDDILCL